MDYHSEIGISAPELAWVPSPTYILRRAAIIKETRSWPRGRVLEVGCGSGSICYELARNGFDCTGVETSAAAREIAEEILADTSSARVLSEIPEADSYDYLMSFEVLEHIEDDLEALINWLSYLRPGGKVLISVPAHTHKWDVTDVAAGHYRRYDREDVRQLIESSGLHSIEITTYGFPASSFIALIRGWVRGFQLKSRGLSADKIAHGDAEMTESSGIERSAEARLFPLYGSFIGRKLMSLLAHAQNPFLKSDLGISFLIKATK